MLNASLTLAPRCWAETIPRRPAHVTQLHHARPCAARLRPRRPALALALPFGAPAKTPAAHRRASTGAAATPGSQGQPRRRRSPSRRRRSSAPRPSGSTRWRRAAFWAREVDADPSDNDARLKLAKALRALGRFDEAGAAADQMLVMQPNNYEALLESARAKIGRQPGLLRHRRRPAGRSARAARLAPGEPAGGGAGAVGARRRRRSRRTRRRWRWRPTMPPTLTNLGMYYATHGDPAQAEPLLRKAAAAPGAGAQERQNLALVLGLEGRLDEAERLERQDLPPAVVDNNLAYLRAATDPAPVRIPGIRCAQISNEVGDVAGRKKAPRDGTKARLRRWACVRAPVSGTGRGGAGMIGGLADRPHGGARLPASLRRACESLNRACFSAGPAHSKVDCRNGIV